MVRNLVDVVRVGAELAAGRHVLHASERRATELRDALGHLVVPLVDRGAKPVEHLVHADELEALEVPVGLLGDQRQVDAVDQAAAEQIDRHRSGVGGGVVARGMRAPGIGSHELAFRFEGMRRSGNAMSEGRFAVSGGVGRKRGFFLLTARSIPLRTPLHRTSTEPKSLKRLGFGIPGTLFDNCIRMEGICGRRPLCSFWAMVGCLGLGFVGFVTLGFRLFTCGCCVLAYSISMRL